MSSSRLRPATADDAAAIAELYEATLGAARVTGVEQISAWLRNTAKLENTCVLEAGGIAGFADFWLEDGCVGADIVAAPDRADELLDWVEARARDAGVAKVRTFFPAGHALARVVEERGYLYWRSAFTMEIELSDEVPPPVPDGITLRSFEPGDDELLRAALNEVFRDGAFFTVVSREDFARKFRAAHGFDPSLWLLAEAGDKLVGFAIGFAEYGSDETLGWIWNLGVKRDWRRRGLGGALLQTMFALLRERGLRRVGLGVDAENATGAVALYERAGMRQVGRLDNWRKTL
ncbi:MAG TPA: GNAT family N-acetyltransferase [Gaiellaceae bacterium]|jgi:mycothiol synthase